MKIFLAISCMFLCIFNMCGGENFKPPVETPKVSGQSKLPKEMPDNVEIGFNANYGNSPAYKKIVIKSGELSFDAKDYIPEKKTFETTNRTAKISREDLQKLYQTFVENEFDTIKNDERKNIVYDAPSEGIFINLSEQQSYQKSYGDNQPMSGENLKRYQTIKKAIFDLAEKFKNGGQTEFSSENQQIFEYDVKELSYYVKNATPAKLADADFGVIEDSLQKAVAEYNQKQTAEAQKIGSLSGYQRQIIPYFNAKGEKEVWINFFCSANGLNWRKIIIAVDDGGSCYFDLKINLVSKNAFDLIVNGSA